MPCVSGDYNPEIGILLQVGFARGGELTRVMADQAGVAADSLKLEVAGIQALIDTGASRTSISPKLAGNLDLPPSGKILVQGATGAKPVNTYAVDIMLSFGRQSIMIEDLEVCEFDPGQAAYQALIGRDILCQGVLTADFAGRFTFSV